MGTYFHRLTQVKTGFIPNKFVVYDTESKVEKINGDEIHSLRLGIACFINRKSGRRKYITFYSPSEFSEFVTSLNFSKIYVFAHNQHFDFQMINGFVEFSKLGWKVKMFVLDSDLFIVNFVKDKQSILFIDSFNYFKESIESLGKIIGLEKMKVDFGNVSDSDLTVYCRRDVDILLQIMLNFMNFVSENRFGRFSMTVAGQAFQAFRASFMKKEILIHSNKVAQDLEIESYKGGRNEIFRIGDINNVSIVDINGLYPFVMKNNIYPTELIGVRKNISSKELIFLIENGYLVVADLLIDTMEPVFAKKVLINGVSKLIFPVGVFRAVLTTPEVKYLISIGKILKVFLVAVYRGDFVFSSYVDSLYSLRLGFKKEGNEIYEKITKLLMNSLYGKFAQRRDEYLFIGDAPKETTLIENVLDEDGSNYMYIVFAGGAWKKIKSDVPSKHSFIAIASHVTAYARLYLYDMMKRVGIRGVDYFYCDTDSLFLSANGFANLTDFLGVELGQFKVLNRNVNVTILGLKDYIVGKEVKTKGIKKDAIKISENTYEQEQFLKIRSLLRKGITDKVIIRKIRKVCKRRYDKGIIMDSLLVMPFIFENDKLLSKIVG